jgi:hypothetical protein
MPLANSMANWHMQNLQNLFTADSVDKCQQYNRLYYGRAVLTTEVIQCYKGISPSFSGLKDSFAHLRSCILL